MAYAISFILEKHGNVMKEQAIDRYGYFLLSQGVYYALSGSSKNYLNHY